jgi:hypothetical protein
MAKRFSINGETVNEEQFRKLTGFVEKEPPKEVVVEETRFVDILPQNRDPIPNVEKVVFGKTRLSVNRIGSKEFSAYKYVTEEEDATYDANDKLKISSQLLAWNKHFHTLAAVPIAAIQEFCLEIGMFEGTCRGAPKEWLLNRLKGVSNDGKESDIIIERRSSNNRHRVQTNRLATKNASRDEAEIDPSCA